MATQEVKVPDIGDFKDVPVIQVFVKAGDPVKPEDPLISLESDKATMDVPSPAAGTVKELKIKVGDRVSEGRVILVLETAAAGAAAQPPAATEARPAPATEARAAPATEARPAPATEARPAPATETRPPAAAPAPAAAAAATYRGQADVEAGMLVIGAGPGGYSAAFRAADVGLKTVLVERYQRLGGVCLNVGCIPSKALLHVARVIDEVEEVGHFGVSFGSGKPGLDLDKLRGWKESVVKKLTGGLSILAKQRKVAVLQGVAQFLDAHHVQVAVGRTPNGKKLAAEKAGVTVTDRGFIPADGQLRTNVPHIFAIGDILGPPMLAHKAIHEGHVAAEAAAGMKSYFDARAIPSVAFTDPEVAWVGVTEDEAKAKGIKYRKGSFPWAASGRSLALGRDEGMTKLLFDEETHRIIGGGIVGTNAGDLISEVGLAIEMGADAVDIGKTIHPHPTLSESVGLSAEAYEGTITDLYVPKR